MAPDGAGKLQEEGKQDPAEVGAGPEHPAPAPSGERPAQPAEMEQAGGERRELGAEADGLGPRQAARGSLFLAAAQAEDDGERGKAAGEGGGDEGGADEQVVTRPERHVGGGQKDAGVAGDEEGEGQAEDAERPPESGKSVAA